MLKDRFVRGRAKIETRVRLAVCVMMALAPGTAKAGRPDRMRSLVRPAFRPFVDPHAG